MSKDKELLIFRYFKNLIGKLRKLLKSMRFRIFIVMILCGIIPIRLLETTILKPIENEMVNSKMDRLLSQCNILRNHIISENYIELIQSDAIDAEMAQLQADVDAAIAQFENQFIELKADIISEVEALKLEIRQEIQNFYNIMYANNEYVFKYVDNRLDEFINSLPEILTVMVYNPYRGEVTDIQTAINDLYDMAAIWGLTATQYDSLGLTASEYDALGLTAREYDTLGYKLLYKDPDTWMRSPFTGEYVRVQEVVTRLAGFHMDGLTAESYDNKELTAQSYDDLELSAFDYDWFANTLIA
jgi:hypothetical protein